jgi:ankyrin repeat protein
MIRLLLERDADQSVVDKNGLTPLHSACIWGQISTALILINGGGDIAGVDENGLTPLHHACMQGHNKIVRLLMNSAGGGEQNWY